MKEVYSLILILTEFNWLKIAILNDTKYFIHFTKYMASHDHCTSILVIGSTQSLWDSCELIEQLLFSTYTEPNQYTWYGYGWYGYGLATFGKVTYNFRHIQLDSPYSKYHIHRYRRCSAVTHWPIIVAKDMEFCT